MEDPTPAELQEGYRLIRRHTTTPIAVGEIFDTVWDAKTLISEQLIDYLRMTVLHGGGITPLSKAATFAGMHHVRTGCHGATDLSPVTMGAALHFDLSVHNFGIQEYMPHSARPTRCFLTPGRSQKATCIPGTSRSRRGLQRSARCEISVRARVTCQSIENWTER